MENEFEVVKKEASTVQEMMISRQAQEVQAAMVIAKKFPRDAARAFDRIMQACQRKGLAEDANYTYPRGTEKVSGPTIRLAEAIAQNWGNIDYGVIELENKNGSSELMAYAWDLETNTRTTKIFTVKHWRDTKQGGYALKDARDIYEATANFGARRVRACILGIIPGDVVDAAVNKCKETLKGQHKTPLEDRFKKMIASFEETFMVGQKQIEEYLGYGAQGFSEDDFIKMQGVFRSLRDGMSKPEDFFKMPKAANGKEKKESAPDPLVENSVESTTKKEEIPQWQKDAIEREKKESEEFKKK